MANVFNGKIIEIGNTADKGKNGKSFIKREFVVQAIRMNRDDFSVELSDYNMVKFEVFGQENCDMLDKFRVGVCVRVSFTLEGRKGFDKDGKVIYYNTAKAYRIEELRVSLPQSTQPAQVQQPMQQPMQPQQPAQGVRQPQHIASAAQQFGYTQDIPV
jgi:hypothetical protein